MAGCPEFLPPLATLGKRKAGGVVPNESSRWVLEGDAKRKQEGKTLNK